MEEHRKRKARKDRKARKASTSSASTNGGVAHEPPPRKRRATPPTQLIGGSLPLLGNRSPSPRKSQRVALSDTAPSRTHSKPSKSEAAAAKRNPMKGARFRNLQHMNNARKKAAQEPPVDPDDPNLKTVSFFRQAPVASPSDEETLFFPENNGERTRKESIDEDQRSVERGRTEKEAPPTEHRSTRGETTQIEQGSTEREAPSILPTITKRLLTNPKTKDSSARVTASTSSPQAPVAVTSAAIENHPTIPVTPVITSSLPDTTQIAQPGPPRMRSWAKSELVVHVALAQHPVGDLKIGNVDGYLRSQLMTLKRTLKSFAIPLAFEQELVLQPVELQKASRDWQHAIPTCYPVEPFEDTARVYQEFSQYLLGNDLTAVWEHPASDMVLVLFAPNSPTWQQVNRYKNTQARPGLVMETRQRVSGLQKVPAQQRPPNRSTVVCRHWRAGNCWRKDDCDFAHTLDVPPPIVRKSSSSAVEPDEPRDSAEYRNPPQPDTLPTGDRPTPSRRQTVATVESVQTPASVASAQPTPDPRIRKERRKSMHESASTEMFDITLGANGIETSEDNSAKHQIDWSFAADFRALSKSIKNPAIADSKMPRIFVAFPEQYRVQSDAVQAWAAQHTSPRCVFSTHEWKELLQLSRRSDPNIFFFHESYPIFTRLEDFFKFIHRDEAACYSVSWTITPDTQEATYDLKLLFPRRHLILITEEVLLMKPKMASYVLEWFQATNRSRMDGAKLMVRPNIQTFLEFRAQALATADKKQESQETLELLMFVKGLLPTLDVTMPGSSKWLADPLDVGMEVRGSSFVPFPRLPDYDFSPTASVDEEEVAKRDRFLLQHFRGFSVTEASQFGRFLVLHNGKPAQGAETQHISFRSVATFVAELEDRKSKEDESKKG